MHPIVRCAIGVAAAASLSLAAPAAHAETQSHDDPKGDVAVFVPTKAEKKRFVDVVRTTSEYTGDRLTVTTVTSHLFRRGYALRIGIRTDTGTYVASYDASSGTPVTSFFLVPDSGGRQGDACPRLRFRTSESTETVTALVPSSCFGDDDTVEIASGTFRQAPNGSVHVDDARSETYDIQAGPTFGPVLSRD